MENGMVNGTTNGTTNGVGTEAADAAPVKVRRGRRKGAKSASVPTTGLVMVSAKLPAEIVRRLDAAAATSFRTRPSQIAYYISQGMKSEEPSNG